MDTLATLPAPVKRRRRHSPAFKAQILAECEQDNCSVAEVALRHGLNLNLVHKWRKSAARSSASAEFVRIDAPVTQPSADTVLVEVPVGDDHIRVHWPLEQMHTCAAWLKALRG